MVKVIASIFLLSLISGSLFAETKITQSNVSDAGQSSLNIDNAKVWDIRSEDWNRYEQIMATEGKYFWKDLDPITILGLNARNTTERRRYAELLAKQEFRNAQKIILLDRAYNKAFLKLYGHLPVIDNSIVEANKQNDLLKNAPKNASFDFDNVGNRYIVFVNTKCTQCDAQVIRIMKLLTTEVTLDIHFKNDTREDITRWASKLDISANDVELGVITLNPNSELYQKFGNPKQPSMFYFDKARNKVNPIR